MSSGIAQTEYDDVTLDAGSPFAIPQRPEVSSSAIMGIELQEEDTGSSGSFDSLLRARLAYAALALGFGAGLFLVWTTIREILEQDDEYAWGFIAFEAMSTIKFIATGVYLYRTPRIPPTILKICEVIIFGLPCAFFAITHYFEILYISQHFSLIPQLPTAGWLILIFSYSLFVPRNWKTILAVSLGMALFPMVSTLAAAYWHVDVRSAIWFDPSCVIELALALIATITISVTSVRMISYLREKADVAKELGRYRLKDKIGSGGMGDVYLAEHRLMKRPCAIKVIRPEKSGDPKAIARFEREVRATSRLTHWNSISIFDYGRTEDGKFYYVMEYLTGLTVQELVKKGGPLSPGRVVYLLRQACHALIEAHGIGLIHRDIKPANLMVTELGGNYDVVKLLDFGLAKPISATVNASLDEDITVAGALTGSPLYMSPEQAIGEAVPDLRSDLYSLGGVAFYMLTGRPPFESKSTLKVLLAHMHETPVAPSEVRKVSPAPSSELDAIVSKCLSKDPQDRYQSASELLAELEKLPESNAWSAEQAAHWWTCNCTHYQAQHG